MDDNIEQHFREEEKPFIEASANLISEVVGQYRPILTKFLNPREAYILTTLVNRNEGLRISYFGGYSGAEMRRGIVYPRYFEPSKDDFAVTSFEIKYPFKFNRLKHSSILGSLLGSGIERNTLGDIITDGKRWQFFCTKEIADFLKLQVNNIGRIKVSVEQSKFNDVIVPENDWKNERTTLSSFRLDNLIANGFNISRSDAKELVNHQRVHLNWAVNNHPDTTITLNDVVSVRRYGRIKLESVNGETKKGKYKAIISVLKK